MGCWAVSLGICNGFVLGCVWVNEVRKADYEAFSVVISPEYTDTDNK
jgi:hypothetical protein